jgi:CDP-diacylglycerol--serine O-phosphatidyltransferase
VLRSLPPAGARPSRRRRPLRTIQALPTLITAGNLIAGILALSYLLDAAGATGAAAEAYRVKAAWMVFLGMVCDALDGRIARLMKTTSAFGAQLDSLADVVTFGAVPALLAKHLLAAEFPSLPGKVAVALVAVYALGAALRLARYNTESAAVAAGAGAHVTRIFRGLPSPAAAGTVASLILLRHEHAVHGIDWAVLIGCPVLGALMISRLPYSHVMNRYVDAPAGLPFVIALAITAFLGIAYFEATVAGLFVLYALTGPVVALVGRLTGRFGWAFREDEDEADEADVLPSAEAPDAGLPEDAGGQEQA